MGAKLKITRGRIMGAKLKITRGRIMGAKLEGSGMFC